MEIYRIFGKIRGYRRLSNMLYNLRKFEKSEVAKERMRIIEFYKQYGEKTTKQAFGVDKKVINRWRKKLKESGGQLMA